MFDCPMQIYLELRSGDINLQQEATQGITIFGIACVLTFRAQKHLVKKPPNTKYRW